MMGVVGISLGIVVWAGVALMGLHLILQKMARCIRSSWSAAAFTCAGWGGSCCVPRGRSKRSRRRRPVALPKAGRSFIRGFLTNLSNPKAVIYFGSVFSLFVGDSVGAGARWGLFLLIVAETFVWFSGGGGVRAAGDAPRLPAAGQVDRRGSRRAVYRLRVTPDLYPLTGLFVRLCGRSPAAPPPK